MRITTHRSPWIAGVLAYTMAIPPAALLRAQTQTAKPATSTQTPQTATPAPATAKPAPASQAKPANTGKPPAGTNADTGWPRAINLKSGTAMWYQPQVESWTGQKKMIAWSAVSYTPRGTTTPALGTIKIEGDTRVALDDRLVGIDMDIVEYNFPSLKTDQVKTLVADVEALPNHERVLDLDRLTAYIADSPLQVKNTEGLKAEPPKIYSAAAPAALVNIDGEPIWSPIKDVDLKYAVNTNWDLFEHVPTKTFYLRYNESWLQATTVTGPWAAVTAKLPDSFKKLPLDDNWKDVKAALPGKALNAKTLPKVFISQEPAELIMIEGPIAYKPVQGASPLLWVSNTEADVFRLDKTGDYYFLVAGRWFKAASLDGPWTFATPTLPDQFKQIPLEHERSRVLVSVPGTPQATEAILLAQIPRTARVNKKQVKAPDVVYQGTPDFKQIEGAAKGVETAANTDKTIIKYGDLYYMCFQGVWFMSRAAEGPWEVATSIPEQIYTIPTSSPASNVTYVTIEDDDDEWVTFAYVAAYTGMMIGWGCVMWGSGWYYPPYRWYGGFYPGYYPYPHTYGMGAWYNPYTGAYGRGYAAYGPYGGVSMGAQYNPRTGTYSRGASAYGPYGSRSYAQAYNPRTGAYGQTRQGSNVYGNWGTSSVQRGDNWAQTAHAENYRKGTSTSGIRTSEGGAAINREGRMGNETTIGRTQGGDIYAGRDGNVYRKTEGGGWEQGNGSGGWNPVDTPDRPNQGPARTGDRTTGTTGDRTAGTGANRPSTTAPSSTRSQLERDSAARSSGNNRTTSRSTWSSGGGSRAGAGSMGGGGARAGGGRRGR
jgi:uncharacterized membrane protein YgcG